MERKPMSKDVLNRLESHRITVISPSTFDYYDRDCEAVIEALKKEGFTNCKCRILEDSHESKFDIGKRLKDAAIIEGKKIC